MASGPNSLPPQAYTREILTAAFNWLQTQPDSVRKTATTPDSLVAIYTRAQRFGAPTLESEAPVSSQNFMSDLKNLAEGLKQFDEPRSEQRTEQRTEAKPESPVPERRGWNHFAGASSSPQPAPFEMASFTAPAPPYTSPPSAQVPPPTHVYAPQPTVAQPALNDRTLAMLLEVRVHLNLSSDHEAINMMVALAYKTLKNLLG